MRWWVILLIIIAVYFLFFRKSKSKEEKFKDPIAQEVFNNYVETKEITRFQNPKSGSEVIITHRGMRHILERHHPDYPSDANKGKGSLFNSQTTCQQIIEGMEKVLRTGRRVPERDRYNEVYEGITEINRLRIAHRLVLNPRYGNREYVVTFFPVR